MGTTNIEKFKEVFGLEIDDASDCGFFDCTDRECKDCPVKNAKDWWNSEYQQKNIPAKWITHRRPDGEVSHFQCSSCNHHSVVKFPYCPICGADMGCCNPYLLTEDDDEKRNDD